MSLRSLVRSRRARPSLASARLLRSVVGRATRETWTQAVVEQSTHLPTPSPLFGSSGAVEEVAHKDAQQAAAAGGGPGRA